MKTKVLFLSFIAVSLLFSSQLFSQNENGKHKNHDCFVDELSEDQIQKIDAIKLESNKKVVNYKADLDIKKAELKKLQVAENPSIKDIHAKIDEIAVVKADIQKEKASKRIAIRNELTPEQQKEYDMHAAKRINSKHKHVGNDKHHHSSKTEHKHMNPDCKNK